MIEVKPRLYVGDESSWTAIQASVGRGWAVVHACKEPHHRQAVGYTGRSPDKNHPEYLVAKRDQEIMLNMVDAPTSKFFSQQLIAPALDFMGHYHFEQGEKVLVHCNQGHSRSPMVVMFYMAPELPEKFQDAIIEFGKLYPPLNFGNGCLEYARQNWDFYHNL